METSIIVPTKRQIIEFENNCSDHALRLAQHGQELAKQGITTAAVTAMKRAVAIDGETNPVLLSILAGCLYDDCDYDEAERLVRKAVELEPEYAPAHSNLGSVLGAKGKYSEAHLHYERAIELDPDYNDAKWNYAMSLLDSGNWSKAWNYYDIRIEKGPNHLYPKLPYPTWKGENLNGKTIWVQGEQGIGDRTLFVRYLHWLKQEYPEARILFCMNANDLPTISNFMWGYRNIFEPVPNGIPWPKDVDYGIYLMSLPRIHGTTPENVVSDPGLLRANALKHKNSIEIKTEDDNRYIKVGVCWQGGPGMKRSCERNIPFEYFLALAEIPNVVLFSLQFGNYDVRNYGADQLICDIVPQIKPLGFAGTAAVMTKLDLVITCCTSVAHVAGAIGVPTWVPVCANPYWVWLRDRTDSVWYPNIKLFRQKEMANWHSVMGQVKDELENFATNKKGKFKLAA